MGFNGVRIALGHTLTLLECVVALSEHLCVYNNSSERSSSLGFTIPS